MARKLNKTVVGVLTLVGIVVIAGSGFVLIKSLPARDPARYAADAAKLEEEEDFERAKMTYQRAFTKDPDRNPEYLVGAARCALGEGKIGEALSFIQGAQVADPSLKSAAVLATDLQLELAELFGSTKRWKDVLDAAQKIRDVDDQSARAHYAIGAACLRLITENESYREKAEAALKRALEIDPMNVDAARLLSGYYLDRARTVEQKGRHSEAKPYRAQADQVLAATLQKCEAAGDPEQLADMKLLLTETEIKKNTRDSDGRLTGVRMLEELAVTAPDTAECYLKLGQYHASGAPGADPQEAVTYLEKTIEIDPGEGRAYLLLGQVYPRLAKQLRDKGKTDEAKAMDARVASLYERGLEAIAYSKHFRALRGNMYRAELTHRLGKIDLARAAAATGDEREAALVQAESRIDLLKDEQGSDSVMVLLARAELLNARGDFIEAVKVAEEADRRAGAAGVFEVKLLLGELYSRRREWGAARDALEAALLKNRTNRKVYWLLGDVYLRLNMPTEAIKLLKPDFTPLREILDQDPTVVRLCVSAYQQMKQFELAEAESERLVTLGGDPRQAVLRKATLQILEGQHKEAEKIIQELLKEDPVSSAAVRAALFLYQSTRQLEKARALVASLVSRYPDNREYRRLDFFLKREGSGEMTDEEAEQFYESEKDEFVRALSLFNWYASHDHLKKAVSHLDAAEAARPDNPAVIDRQFVVAVRMKDFDRAERYAGRLAKLNQDGTDGKIVYGRLAAAKGDTDRAITLMREGLGRYPTYSMGHTYLGEIYAGAGRMGEARTSLLRALELDPTNGLANRLMAQMAVQDGDEQAEEQYLRAAARVMPNDSWVRSELQILDERKDPQTGIASREKRREQDPSDVKNLIRLARLYKLTEQYDQAEEAYRAALEAARTDEDIDELRVAREFAWFYASPERQQPDKGEAILNAFLSAGEERVDKARISMLLAGFYEYQDRVAMAERHVRTAVTFDDSVEILIGAGEFFARTNRLADALDFYQRAMKASPGDHRAIHARIVSLLLALRDLENAHTEVDNFLHDYPDDPQGLVFLGTYNLMGGDIEEAERAFRTQLEKHPESAVAHWQLGRLYALKGQWQRAIDVLRQAKTFSPNGFNYRHRVTLANALIEAGKGNDAVIELRTILDEHPDQIEVALSLIDVYLRIKPPRYADAEHLIRTHMRRDPKDESWPLQLAKVGERSGNWDEAIEGYEIAARISRYRPAIVESFFTVLKRAGRADEVIQLAEKTLSERALAAMPQALATLGWAYRQSGRKDDALAAYDRALSATASRFGVHAAILQEMISAFGADVVQARMAASGATDVAKQKSMLQMLYLSRKLDQAESAARKLLKEASSDADRVFAHLGLAALLSETNRLDESKAQYEAALRINDANTIALNNLAFMLSEDLDRPSEALPYAERAAKLRPRNADILDTFGWILSRLGRVGEAETRLLQAVDIDRHKAAAMVHLGITYQKRGDKTEAVRWLKAARDEINSRPKQAGTASPTGPDRYLPMIEEALKGLE